MDAFLDSLLIRLSYASVQALLLAGIVYAVCRLVPRLTAAARSTLWWLLGAQLLIGVACPSVLGLPLLPATTLPAVMQGVQAAGSDTGLVDATTVSLTTSSAAAPTFAATGAWPLSWTTALLGAWLIVVLFQCALAAVRWHELRGVVRRAMPHDDVRVETLCARRARELGVRRSPRLAVSPEVDSPQVIGLWRPTILLPLDDRLDDAELDMALMHELAHIRRGDLLLGCVPALARTLFFFHPLVHLAVREYALCREAACDALVVERGRQTARTYGRLLVRLGVAPRPHHALPGASPTFRTLKRRLDMLAQTDARSSRVLTWSIVAAIALVGVLPWRVVAADGGSHPGYVMPPAPPLPPAPPAPAAPAPDAAPSADAMVMPPPAPPAPAAPAAPVEPAGTITDVYGGHPSHAFMYFGDGINVMSGSESDMRRAEAERSKGGSFVWYRDGQKAWVLRDPAYVKRIHEAFAHAQLPADQGKLSADKQMELDGRQAVLNEQMAKLAQRQADLAIRESDATGPRDASAYAQGHAALAHEQSEIGRQMAEIGRQRAMQGQTQAEWGRRQAEASRKASDEVDAILAEAVRNHAAQAAR